MAGNVRKLFILNGRFIISQQSNIRTILSDFFDKVSKESFQEDLLKKRP